MVERDGVMDLRGVLPHLQIFKSAHGIPTW